MAIDTKNKRASVMGVTLPFRSILPSPDSTISAMDRATVGLLYALGDESGGGGSGGIGTPSGHTGITNIMGIV